MFVDRVKIRIVGGAGGAGCCSFRREKYMPHGGPDGGDGGNGGDVFLVASSKLHSLLDLRYHSHWKGRRGGNGLGSDCHGRHGDPLEILVPQGTAILNAETGEVLADLTEDGQRYLAAHGGKGGRGNPRFVSGQNRLPRFAEKGEPGEEVVLQVELKLIAEVGIVGLPNAGKSTLLSSISAATPKIDSYPFTTLTPNLGVVDLPGFRSLTVADIPGIIEGAAEGKGLGHDFLRHIERTKVLLFLIDLGDEDPVNTRDILEDELARYSDAFADRPRVYALNKADVTENRERFPELHDAFDQPSLVSGATGEGVPELLERLWAEVEEARRREREEAEEAEEAPVDTEYTYEAPFTITREPAGFRIEGRRLLQAVLMTDFENTEAVRHLQQVMRKMGLFKALKRLRAHAGDSIFIGDHELEYHPE